MAGVSPASVSRVIHSHPQVSDELRQRVEQAIADTGYKPPRANGFGNRSTKSRVVALVVPQVSSPFYCSVLEGVEQAAFSHGYDLTLYTTEGRSQQNVVERVLQAGHTAGLVVITPRHGEGELLAQHEDLPPVVVVDHRSQGSRYPSVEVDNLRGAYEAVQYLLGRGYERIGMIAGPLEITSGLDRLRGFRLALEEGGLAFDEGLVMQGDFEQQSGYQAVADWIGSCRALPRALFCANDLMALGAIAALHEYGFTVPADVAVMGFDDLAIAATAVPPLTTIRQPSDEMGSIALRMVLRLAAGEELEADRIVLKTELIQRESA